MSGRAVAPAGGQMVSTPRGMDFSKSHSYSDMPNLHIEVMFGSHHKGRIVNATAIGSIPEVMRLSNGVAWSGLPQPLRSCPRARDEAPNASDEM
jgi:hypothetical protein